MVIYNLIFPAFLVLLIIAIDTQDTLLLVFSIFVIFIPSLSLHYSTWLVWFLC